MSKVKVKCENCGKELYRYKYQIPKHVFCSIECSKTYTSERMSEMNRKLNPERMTEEVKNKIRATHILSSDRKTYPKINHRHAHRVMAEKKLGRKLKPGEIVHHKDGDKQNYSPENLEILESQSVHIKLHKEQGDL